MLSLSKAKTVLVYGHAGARQTYGRERHVNSEIFHMTYALYMYPEQFYAIIPTLFPYFLLFYILTIPIFVTFVLHFFILS